MKIALCLSGQMRTYEACHAPLREHLIEPLRPDVFIHTWTVAGSSHKEAAHPGADLVTAERLDRLYRPRLVAIEPYREEYRDRLGDVEVPAILKAAEPRHYPGALPMFYKIHACNRLKAEWERRNGFTYDLVIRLRPDLELAEPIPGEVLAAPQVLWHTGHGHPEFQASDRFAAASSANMDYYCSVWERLAGYWRAPLGDGRWVNHRVGERLMRHHLEGAPCPVRAFAMRCRVLRAASPAAGPVAGAPA